MDNLNISGLIDLAAQRLSLLFSGHLFSGLADNTEIIGTLLFLALIISLTWSMVRGIDRESVPILILFVVLFIFYLFVPFRIHVRWVPERTSIYLLLVGFLALSVLLSGRINRSKTNALAGFIIFSAIVLVSLSTYKNSENHAAVNKYYAEYLSALGQFEHNSTILAIRVISPMPDSVGMSLHHKLLQGGSYYAISRDSVDVKLFQARSRFVPVAYKPEKNPYSHWIKDEEVVRPVPKIDLEKFSNLSDKPLDYILVWGNLREAFKYPQLASPLKELLEKIDREYKLISVSQPLGYMHLFKNRKS